MGEQKIHGLSKIPMKEMKELRGMIEAQRKTATFGGQEEKEEETDNEIKRKLNFEQNERFLEAESVESLNQKIREAQHRNMNEENNQNEVLISVSKYFFR
jgi:archaellum component FlaD/FlaE